MTKFDKLVYYQVCDFFYDEFRRNLNMNKKAVGYQTFYNMCGSISIKVINNGVFSRNERVVINRGLDRLKLYFGFSDEEAAKYVYNFFSEKIWIKLHESVTMVNSAFMNSKNI